MGDLAPDIDNWRYQNISQKLMSMMAMLLILEMVMISKS